MRGGCSKPCLLSGPPFNHLHIQGFGVCNPYSMILPDLGIGGDVFSHIMRTAVYSTQYSDIIQCKVSLTIWTNGFKWDLGLNKNITTRLIKCGEIIGIEVIDHIIIGDGLYYSFKENMII